MNCSAKFVRMEKVFKGCDIVHGNIVCTAALVACTGAYMKGWSPSDQHTKPMFICLYAKFSYSATFVPYRGRTYTHHVAGANSYTCMHEHCLLFMSCAHLQKQSSFQCHTHLEKQNTCRCMSSVLWDLYSPSCVYVSF